MRNATAALAVVLIHAAAISVLLSTRDLLRQSTAAARPEPVTYWIRLPQATAPPAVPVSPPQRGLPMLPIFGETEELGAPVFSAPPPTPAVTALPLLSFAPDSTALSSVGEYFACSFTNYENMTDAERQRCAIALSNVGPYSAIGSDYTDFIGTPFSLFGARGRLTITAATKPYLDGLSANIGCGWAMGLCRPILPPTFGIDPDDQTRGSILAEFDLGRGFTLYAGAQGYMQNFLGGARPIITTGVRVTYRW